MGHVRPWVDAGNAALLLDQYQLTMLQAYLAGGMTRPAAFSLFVRKLPASRNFLLACGLEQLLELLEELRFGPAELEALSALGLESETVEVLEHLRFTGDVWAVPEGTPVFAGEPLLEIVAPLPEAQLVETIALNQVHLQTLLASKAVRVVEAAAGRDVVEFGLRRAQGADAGLKGARAAYVAGCASTSNVLAGAMFGIPISGTMAHSFVQAHRTELDAFRAWCATHPASTLLVDTYDTLEGVRRVVHLAHELGRDFKVQAIRLDSGDLDTLSRRARALLDSAELGQVRIFASGGLDEEQIAKLVAAGAPIDGFGVGTAMSVSTDAPALDCAYKLVEYDGQPRLKLSEGKVLLPGRKQVFRGPRGDVIARFGEVLPGRPLLEQVMKHGRRLAPSPPLSLVRQRARAELARLPDELRGLAPARGAWPVTASPALQVLAEQIATAVLSPEREQPGGGAAVPP